eukprot:7752860-Pyramimonas_sp.AAC.1
MASCASGTLPQSMPLATSDPYMPIPGITNEPPPATPAQSNQDDDPYCGACEELYHKLILLLEDYPGVWASYNSGEKQEPLHPTIVKHAKDAHALTWI